MAGRMQYSLYNNKNSLKIHLRDSIFDTIKGFDTISGYINIESHENRKL